VDILHTGPSTATRHGAMVDAYPQESFADVSLGTELARPAMLRAYIQSNLAFMREHRNYMVAVVEILRNGALTTGRGRRLDGRDVDIAAHLLEEQLARLQDEGELRSDFDPGVMAVAIRATIDVVPHRLVRDPDFDIDTYSREIIAIFDLATRAKDNPGGPR
jgi:hypothetical protein